MLDYILKAIDQIELPSQTETSASARTAYRDILDYLGGYRGDPHLLLDVIRRSEEIDSYPFVCALLANVIIAAAYQSGDNYEARGLNIAETWLERAWEFYQLDPDIDFVMLYINLWRKDYEAYQARWNQLAELAEDHFESQITYLIYCQKKEGAKEARIQYEKLLPLVVTDNQLRRAHGQMADMYLRTVLIFAALQEQTGENAFENIYVSGKEAIKYFELLQPFSEEDPWFWHNYSLALFHMGKYWRAAKFNKKALSIMQFSNAQKLQQGLQAKLKFLYRLI